ncbi:MAG TPA: DUF1028 domain-containing protein [Rhodobacterales bacterium]|nr:DUF1028 domain-containing protein [Rhodobacterales bacterium]
MTFSILARDPDSNAIGGAAATGSLCVGGWVLRGDLRAGMSASQGLSPSTFWGEDVLTAMGAGQSAKQAVDAVTSADAGRAQRQLAALGLRGEGAVFSGDQNLPAIGARLFPGGISAGNMLTKASVVDAMTEAYLGARGTFAARLLAALREAQTAGGDTRGLLSAALLILSPDHAPLTLRIDYHEDPLQALEALHVRATTGDYAEWCRQVPTMSDPERGCD